MKQTFLNIDFIVTLTLGILVFGTACSSTPDCDYNGDKILGAIATRDDTRLTEALDGNQVPERRPGQNSYLLTALLLGNARAAEILAMHGANLTLKELNKLDCSLEGQTREVEEFLRPLFPYKMVPRIQVQLPDTAKIHRSPEKERKNLGEDSHVVQVGETLSFIARQRGVSLKKLKEINKITGEGIQVGQTLVIPATSENSDTCEKKNASVAKHNESPKNSGHTNTVAHPEPKPPTQKKIILNPRNYIKSGERMGVIIYTETTPSGIDQIIGVESCTIGSGGYSGCDFIYKSSGNSQCHTHFRDNVHVSRASKTSRVIGCNADGKFQEWQSYEYDPDNHFEKVIWLTNSQDVIVAYQAKKRNESYTYSLVRDKGLLKEALECLEKGEVNSYFVNRYGGVSRK